jgi:RND family efflux transporter MFP subunit
MKPGRLVLHLLLICAPAAAGAAEGADASAKIQIVAVAPGSVHRNINVFGKMEADPTGATNFTAPHGGQVFRIMVRPGEAVAGGAPLLTLVPGPAEQQAFAQAQNDVGLARRDLAQAQARRSAGQASTAEIIVAQRKFQIAESNVLAGQARFGANRGEETVAAPYGAKIVSLLVNQGTLVLKGTPMLVLAPESALLAVFKVEAADVKRIHDGALAIVYPVNHGGNRVTTHVERFGGQIDAPVEYGNIAIRLRNTETIGFTIGMRIAATIRADEHRGLVVPFRALKRDARGDYVFRLEGDRARRAAVQIGLTDGERTVVEKGLEAGEKVIVSGGDELRDGMVVHDTEQTPGH